MIHFAELYTRLDRTTKTNQKISALIHYFEAADPADAAWATHFLSGNRLGRVIATQLVRTWAAEEADIPAWLFEESYQTVGDLAETVALVVPDGNHHYSKSLAECVCEDLLPMRDLPEADQRSRTLKIWRNTTKQVRFVFMKLLTGGFRVGVSKRLLIRALSKHSGVNTEVIAHRLMGTWESTAESFLRLVDPDEGDSVASRPYPFCLAHAVDNKRSIEQLGEHNEYAAEWKWDGIRGQLIRRQGQTFLWSRGEILMENTWPEIEAAAASLPDGTVLDGEILAAATGGDVLPFDQLQRRIGKKRVGKKLLKEVPVVFHAFDLLEREGEDIRLEPFASRRKKLEALLRKVDPPNLRITQLMQQTAWDQLAKIRETSRQHHAEGLMLKRLDASYSVGRVTGTWWKWKVDPHTIDGVLIYGQKGHGRRANLFSDYTFAVWDGDALVPFAKAYSGLSDQEIRQVDRFIRQNTSESFGPVRSVTPTLVMEIAFEGLRISKRHKSGVATRFPRIVRWRHDKQPSDASSLAELKALLDSPTEPIEQP